uniref:Uncharacterized protein n=1 Tax=Knipowitschia caucasica TaxID=637954 RepID=A0AAV2J1B6_KNICA
MFSLCPQKIINEDTLHWNNVDRNMVKILEDDCPNEGTRNCRRMRLSVRMAERSKALRSGRSLPWRRGFESHF